LRILLLGLNYSPELTGIGKYSGEMMEWLAERGHEVRVVTAPPYYPEWRVREDYRFWAYRSESSAAGSRVYRCPLYVPHRPNGARRLLHLASFALTSLPVMLRHAFWRPDVVMTVEPALLCAPMAVLLATICGGSAWLHVQDFEIDAAFDLELLPSGGTIHRIALAYERAIMGAFDRVSSISPNMVRRLSSKGVPERKTVLFPNWVDVDAVTARVPGAEPNRFREELGIGSEQTVLLYSGNLGHKQGLEILPQVAVMLKERRDLHFVFCGDGAYRRPLEQMTAGLSNVSLLHLQPKERLNELLNAADIHLLPQRADAADLVMPSKLTGMMSSGRPTIASSPADTQLGMVIAGGSDGKSPCGLVIPPEDVNAMVQAVQALASNAEERTRMGEHARQYAVKHLGREQVLEQFERDLRSAVAEYRGLPFERPQTPFRFALVDRRRRRRAPAPPVPAE